MTNIYKTTATLIFLMVAVLWPAAEAWGQAVKGNRYKTSVTVVKKYYAAIEDDNNTELQKAFDGDRETWWDAASAGPKTITIELETNQKLASVNYYGGGNGTNVGLRPSEVQVYYSSNGYEWNPVQTFSDIDRTVRDRTLTITENNRVPAKFYRLVLVPGLKDDGSYQTLAMNEITLYSQGGGEIDVPSPDEETIGNLADKTIIHKHPKWFELRDSISTPSKNMDTFNDDIPTFGPPEDKDMVTWTGTIQAAHTYIDTIYMHPGTSVTLTLPDKLNDVSVRGYQRWYSFRTDGTYRTNNTGSDEVWDLLTPTVGTSYRFANGYVSKPIDTNANGTYQMRFYFPTSEEFRSWFNINSSGFDGNWFVVACDVSGYNDYTETFNVNTSSGSNFLETLYEPTLTHRVLYYIASVDKRTGDKWTNGHGRLSQEAYRGGGNTEGKKYLEEYEISFPYTRMSNTQLNNQESNQPSPEQVALSKDARAYAIPKELLNGVSDTDELTVTLIDGDGSDDEKNSGIKLIKASTYKVGGNSYRNYTNVQSLTITISGENRVIQFAYPTTNSNGTQSVLNNNSTATILVTKTVGGTIYNIARFKLNFVADTRLLTQSQLEAIEAGDEGMKYYQFRTPEYLDKNYQLLTALNWDYDPEVAGRTYGQDKYYPFPMAWDYSSYSFFDGALRKDFVPVTKTGENENEYPEWGYYAIMNDFVEDIAWGVNDKASLLPNSTYHLYVDASDRPGVIANLPFRQPLCKGSELFVTAWVKSAGFSIGTSDAGMLFTINGVEADGAKVPLYSHSTSQIRRTDYLSDQIPGCGSGKNEWLQVYFSFINEGDVAYESYELQVSNNSESTSGGDMYLDDVRVYMQSPSATVKQKQAVCGNDRALVRLQLGWDQLYSRLGGDIHTADAKGAIDFCIIDTLAYREYIPYGSTSKTIEEIKDAIAKSTVNLGNGTTYDEKYATLYYKWDYDDNASYNEKGINLAAENPITQGGIDYAFYSFTEGNRQTLAVDIYAALEGSRGYWLLMVDHNDSNAPSDGNYAGVFENPDDRCAMKDVFKVTAQNLIKINGKVVGDTEKETYCAGQVFNFKIAMTYPDPNNNGKETVYNGQVYFDWYFGTKSEFEDTQNIYGVSIKDALSAFRTKYPDATELTETTPVDSDGTPNGFYGSHRSLLLSLLNPIDDNHLNTPLVLHQEAREIRIMEGGLNLVVVPINTLEENNDFYTLLCWNPIFFTLNAKGKAPELSVGFNDVTYPNTWEGAIRVGLEQIKNAVVNGTTTINIPLRNAKLTTDGSTGTLTDIENKNELYLIDSNDPVVEKIISQDDFDPFAYSIGTLVDLSAGQRNGNEYNENDIMKVRFNLTEQTIGQDVPFTFNPREGYWYKFEVYFQEEGGASDACHGNLFVTMHVVPAFQKWVGESTGNWNNDENWVRSTKEELKKSDSYVDYTDGHKGYVPMDFTKVTIPTNKQVELYSASASNTGSIRHPILDLSTQSPSGETTENIEYDLMVNSTLDDSNAAYNCIPYYTNTVNEIHFEPGAEMKHAELLDYKKAWVDYQLEKGRWYALSSPLKDVVSGDFYTDPSGTEKQEYFTDITFDGKINGTISSAGNVNEDNSRTAPSVYQRGWKNADATMVGVGSGDTGERAIAGNWSAVYNKADEGYDAGTGFSLKVLDLPEGTNNATFRLPKADTEYTYSGGTTTAQETNEITRTNANKLHVTDLSEETETSISVPLKANGNNPYYLVGNPFMAHLDMDAFFTENSNLERKYWVVDNNSQTVAVGKEEDLTTTDPTGDATVAPLQSFFVQKANNETGEITVKFTQDMQVLGGTGDGLRSANALTITATTDDGRQSRAAVAYDMAASADYEASEDAELFLDSNLGDVPMVYTVAGTMATSINRTSELYNIPLGVYGSKQEMVTLSFGGLNQFSSATLYDAQEQTETPLREGKTVSVPAGTSGRYFLRAGTPTGNEVIARNAFLVYSVGGGKVMVTSSNTPLKDIRVYTMGGAQVRSIQASGMQQEIYLNRGIYLITVSDQDGLQETRKVLVR